MSLKLGIVGLPNVGKSTLFKALTKKSALIANYPFATIDPNVGVVRVPDSRLDDLARVSQSEQIIPTTIEFVDIAGLVAGAAKGEGLGNKFLSHIREVDAIVHVVRAFSDKEIIHVSGVGNPQTDLEIVNTELALADLETVIKRQETVMRELKSGKTPEVEKRVSLFLRLRQVLESGGAARELALDEDERIWLKELNLLTAKPMLICFNSDEDLSTGALGGHDARDWIAGGGASLPATVSSEVAGRDIPSPQKATPIIISAKIEAELADLSPEDAAAFMGDLGWSESGLDRLIKAGYELLNLVTFLTSGPKETRAWTITAGTKAPQAAGVIHSDFEKAFIRAEVINWSDFVACNGEARARERGLLRTEGKEYIVKDGDVCHFLVNV